MGSNCFGEVGFGCGGGGGGGRRLVNKKGNKTGSDKPRQPQRGLGVAQLEKIRLQGQTAEYLPSLLQRSPYHNDLNMDDARTARASSWPPASTVDSAVPSSLPALYPNMMVAYGAAQGNDTTYNDFRSNAMLRFPTTTNNAFPTYQHTQQNITLPLFAQTIEDTIHNRWRGQYDQRCHIDFVSLDSDNDDTDELDLELRL